MWKSGKNIKRTVKQTVDTYSLTQFTISELKGVIRSKGYTIINYYPDNMSEETEKLMEMLDVLYYGSVLDSFTYCRCGKRIVFINGTMAEKNLPYYLALEIANIIMNEPGEDGVLGQQPSERIAANEFAHYLIDYSRHGILYNMLKYRLFSAVVAIAVSIFVVMCLGFTFITVPLLKLSENSSAENLTGTEAVAEPENNGFVWVANAETVVGTDSVSETSTETVQEPVTDVFAVADTPEEEPVVKELNVENKENFIVPTDERVYYATKSGKKYHIDGCSYISGKETISLSAYDVENRGYEPCSRCFK